MSHKSLNPLKKNPPLNFPPSKNCITFALQNTANMITKTLNNRKLTSFRLNEGLLIRLKVQAKKENRSLNNYVECALMGMLNRKPNKTTLAAIKEAQENDNMETLDMENFESFVASL